MSSEKEIAIHQAYLDSSNRFDHFLLGASLAACGYLAQTNPYGRIGYNVETMYLVALVSLAMSAFCGFRRLDRITGALKANAHFLALPTNISRDARLRAKALVQQAADAPGKWYSLRNGFLYAGFVAYIGTKVFAQYLQP
ncbi:hypothetical protein LJG15_06615 [Pseudomonas aeruginosa]|uniref:hypothetical protein n=1 Tax=Pseudomonas aeruginosa TaxID=287 RepID=UPI0008A1B9BE|nr:hypothetical protein [Pseudomonas aeruginosa]MBQ9380016.1 hypothetical protein [Pseudomonas sp.]MCC0349714.1 hypothetical protein [Pseudomonas aeruginosa]MDI3569488.1 hypothetical protein [Pseudomonas aeruginosa]MDI3586169.1 hypothetical protein [Pseudomonas aeruginosa]MDI3739837.1 hypothetical protein [Pseudomonas aeruginosa]